MSSNKFTLALIQMQVGSNKSENLQRAQQLISKAVASDANIVALPECFNSPYGTQYFAKYAENIPDGETVSFLSGLAKKHGIYLIGGSIPEVEGDKLYNTCTVYGPDGTLLTKYRKMHLFDMNCPGKCVFKESDVFTPGNTLATFDTPFCKIGLGICYDSRVPELAELYSKRGCKMLIYPGAFDMYTGPLHWTLLARSRALDSQVYVAAVCEARDESANYVAWGHSIVTSPWGDVVKELEHNEDILITEIDLDRLDEIRQQIPINNQRRHDVYSVCDKTQKI